MNIKRTPGTDWADLRFGAAVVALAMVAGVVGIVLLGLAFGLFWRVFQWVTG